ncbi:MAG: hypothetical protein ACXVB0_13975 [Mucilaginibacter sp.]
MKTLSFILIALLGFSCTNHNTPKKLNYYSGRGYLKTLQKRKALIDRMPAKDSSALTVFVKMNNKSELVQVFNGKFPEDSVESTYNVLMDKGKVIMIMWSPYSESGDWDVECLHYFNTDGHTFAFEKQASAFALQDDGVAYETTTDYFDPQFKNIRHIYRLVDKDKKALDKSYAFDRGGFDCKIYPTATECLKAYHIILTDR